MGHARLTATATLALLAVAGLGVASAGPVRVTRTPLLVQVSRGSDTVLVAFQLVSHTARVRVWIDGRSARPDRVGYPADRYYQAFLRRAGLSSGRMEVGRFYPVSITTYDTQGTPARSRFKLDLHSRFPRS